jgi:hypothetical protein
MYRDGGVGDGVYMNKHGHPISMLRWESLRRRGEIEAQGVNILHAVNAMTVTEAERHERSLGKSPLGIPIARWLLESLPSSKSFGHFTWSNDYSPQVVAEANRTTPDRNSQ